MGRLTDHSDVINLMKCFTEIAALAASMERAQRGGITREACDRDLIAAIKMMHGAAYNAVSDHVLAWAQKESESLRIVITKTLNEAGRKALAEAGEGR